MFRKSRLALTLVGLALIVQSAVRSAPAAEPLPPASQWLPPQAFAVLEISQPKDVLDLAFSPKVIETVTSLPAYQQLTSQPNFKQFMAVVQFLEAKVNTDWKTGVRKIFGGGITLAVIPGDAVVLMVDAKDAKLLNQLHEIFVEFARNQAKEQGQPDRVASKEYNGVTGWTFGGDEIHAIVGNRVIISNKPDALKTVLDLRANSDAESLASVPSYQAAKKAAGPDATATAFVNLALIKLHPPVREALEQGPNPAASLLIPGVTEALRESTWATAALHVKEKKLSLQATLDGKAETLPYMQADGVDGGALPNVSVPRQIAGLSFFRDLHKFYAAKDELFPERTSGLIFFENMMGIFFTGRDLTEEVLAATKPEVRFVVAEQAYDGGTPKLQFPSFAAIFRLHDPDKFALIAEEAWQKALGLVNFTRGQQALAGLIIDRPTHADTKFSMAYFSTAGEEDKQALDSHFNFQPSLACVGDYLVFSSTAGLTRDLIDALKKETAGQIKALADTHTRVEVDIIQLASILGANRDNLVRQLMLNEGSTKEEAGVQMDLITHLLQRFGRARLDLGTRDGLTHASLKLVLDLP